MKILKNNPLTVICLLVCFGATALIAFAGAAISVDAGTIQACYNNTSGELRIVNSAADCRVHEAPISWNISGPAGPPGPPGADANVTAFRHTHTAENECVQALRPFSIIDHPSLNGNSNALIFVTALIGINDAGTNTNSNSSLVVVYTGSSVFGSCPANRWIVAGGDSTVGAQFDVMVANP